MFDAALEGIQEVIWDAVESIISILISTLTKPIFDTTASLYDLVYGVPGEKNYGILTAEEITNAYAPSFTIMFRLAAFFVLIAIVLSAYKTSGMAISPSNRTQVIEFWKDLLIISIVLFNLEFFYSMFFEFNDNLVKFFEASVKESYSSSTFSKETNLKDLLEGEDSNFFYLICVVLIEAGLQLWATFYYVMRKITILILMILGPVMVALWLMQRKKAVTLGWIREFTGTVLIQAVHAFVFWLIIQINMDADQTSIVKLIVLAMFIPIGEHIRSLFGLGGDMQNGLTRAAAYTGLRTIGALSSLAKDSMNGISASDMIRNGINKARGKENNSNTNDKFDDPDRPKNNIPGANTGTDTGTTGAAARMLKPGEIMSRMGKATLGAAGTIAGSPLGPIGSIVGTEAGAALGAKVGGLTGRLGAASINSAIGIGAGVGKQLKKSAMAGKNSFISSKNGQNLDNQALIDDWTTKDFEAWKHDNPDSTLHDTLSKQFPSASAQQLDSMVQGRNKNMLDHFRSKNASAVGKTLQDGKQFANAGDLVRAATVAYADNYTNENKDSFMNSLPTSYTPEQKEDAWNAHLSEKTGTFNQLATSTAKSMGALSNKHTFANGMTAFDNSFIDKAGFNDALQNQMKGEHGNSLGSVSNAISSVSGQSIKNADGSINRGMFANLSAQRFVGAQMEANAGGAMNSTAVETSYAMAHQSANTGPIIKAPTGVKEEAIAFTKASIAGVDGFINAMTEPVLGPAATAYGAQISEGGSPIQATVASVGAVVNNALGNNDMERQYNWTKGIAYAGGVVAGVGGYQIASNFASNFNPFNKAVQNKTMEIGQISQAAPKVVDSSSGQEAIKQGAVRLVTTTNQSYIEMTDQAGQKQVVSRYGSGDSSLQNGQVVYQDLDVQNGQLVSYGKGSQSNAYIEDSTGSKISINRPMNINPNKLVSNQNTTVPTVSTTSRPTPPTSFNSKVDSGTMYINDVQNGGFQDIQMVIERDKSYMVGTDNTGTVTRISPFGKGDTRLKMNQRVERSCEIVNQKFIVRDDSVVNYGEQTSYIKPHLNLSDYDPNTLIGTMPNPRLARRNMREHEENVLGVSC